MPYSPDQSARIRCRTDDDFRSQGPVNWAAVRDLRQPFALRVVQRALDLDFLGDLVDEAHLGLAIGAVPGVDPALVERYAHPFERPALALGIEA
jgi:phage gp36-like protein